MRCPLSTWRKKAVEVDFFVQAVACLGCIMVINSDATAKMFEVRMGHCSWDIAFVPSPAVPSHVLLLQRLQRNLVRLSFLCFVRLAIVAVHHSTRSCRHFRARVCSVPKMRGATRCVGQRHGVRWWGAQGAWSDGSLGLKAKDGQGQAEKVDLWLQWKGHSVSLHRILLRLA